MAEKQLAAGRRVVRGGNTAGDSKKDMMCEYSTVQYSM